MYKLYVIDKIDVTDDQLIIISDGIEYKFKLSEVSERLEHASSEEKKDFIVSPSGYGIHWPRIDEDISIHELLHNLIK
ncbi:MAG: DUF2442 domain-containing protein [Bacteroidota bacterium]